MTDFVRRMDARQALELISRTEFQPLTERDRIGLQGASDKAVMGECDDILIIIDGATVEFVEGDYNRIFRLERAT